MTKISVILSTARLEHESFFPHWLKITNAIKKDKPCDYRPLSLVKEPFRGLLLKSVYNHMNSFLEPTLESLCNQTFDDFEVIIVDWHRDKRSYIAPLYDNRLNIKHIRDRPCKWFDLDPPEEWLADVTPAFPNVSGARNAGVIVSEGELLMFIDDNILLEPKTLETAWKYYQKGYGLKLIRNRFDVELGIHTTYDQIKLYREFEGNKQYDPLWGTGSCTHSYRGAWSHGFTVSLEDFLVVNGFEEVLVAGTVGGEDIDLANRLHNLLERPIEESRMALDTNATIWELGHYHIHRGRPCVRLNIALLDIIRDWETDILANTRKPTPEELEKYKKVMIKRGERIHPYWDKFLVEPFNLEELMKKYQNGELTW